MKTLFIDCGMGAAGDMLTAALLELLPDPDAFLTELNALGIPGVLVKRESSAKCGIYGTRILVTVDGVEEESIDMHEHGDHHEHLNDFDHDHMHPHHQAHDHRDHSNHAHGSHHNLEYSEHIHCHQHDRHHDHIHQAHDHRDHSHTHDHNSLKEIEEIVQDLELSNKVKNDVMAVYNLIAKAESRAHNVPVTDVHFHEVGAMDAIADITAVAMLMERIAPEQVFASPIHVGSGQVRCAHGILPVPAPATAYILEGVPIYGGRIRGELCTPTGAALLKYFVDSFGEMPVMKVEKIGYGMGKKDFEAANCVRAMLGETDTRKEEILELKFNVDDMSAEAIAFAADRFFEVGAVEVFTVPVGMKKSRPGTLITVLCHREDKEQLLHAIFKHSTTIGVRELLCNRHLLERSVTTLKTQYGSIRRKDAKGFGVARSKYEYDDLARLAKEMDLSLVELVDRIEREMD